MLCSDVRHHALIDYPNLFIPACPCFQPCCNHMFSLPISILFLSRRAEGMFAFRMILDVKFSLSLAQPHSSSGTQAVMPGPGPSVLSRSQQALRAYVCLRRPDSPSLLCVFFPLNEQNETRPKKKKSTDHENTMPLAP